MSRWSQSAADQMQGRFASPVVRKDAGVAGPMTPRKFSFLRPHHHCLPPTSHWGLHGSWALLFEHDGDQDGQIIWTDGALSRLPTPMSRSSSPHKQFKPGLVRRKRRRAMMTFAALVVAAILAASILYAMFSRAR